MADTTAILGVAILGQMVLGDSTAPPAGVGGIALDPHMTWRDEGQWTPVRERVRIGCTGKEIVTTASLYSGRPITLTRGDAGLWATRDILRQLQALRDTAGWAGLLTLPDGRQFQVRWDHAAGPIDIDPARLLSEPDNDDIVRLTLRFREIPAS